MPNPEQLTQTQQNNLNGSLNFEPANQLIQSHESNLLVPIKKYLVKAGAVLVASGVALGIGFSSEEDVAIADHQVCISSDYDGNCVVWVDGPHDTTAPPPKPTNPPSGGGGGGGGTTPTTTPYAQRDSDGDGIINGIDNCDNVVNPDQANFDNDVDGDVCDADIDNDGISNDLDVNNFSVDNDNDGLHDAFDPDASNPDIDGDGVLDGDPTELEDKFGDGTQDLFQSRTDIDGDGYSAETGDIDEANVCIPSAQSDICDQDSDGFTNLEETKIGTDPKLADTDGDGINDGDDKEPLSKVGAEVDDSGVEVQATTSTIDAISATTEGEEVVTDISEDDEETSITETTTTEAIISSVDSNDSNRSSNDTVLPVSLGGLAALGLGGFGIVLFKRRKKTEVAV